MPQVKLGNTLTYSKAGIKRIQPTLVLGLGGTGKEVILRLRQRFFEKHGTVGFHALRYLWLDTDLRNQNIDGKPLDYIKDEVQFQEYEKIDLEITQADYLALFQNRNTKQHIFRWLDPSLQSLGSVVDGARQIRALGRLSFFHHVFSNNNIRDHLGRAVEHLLSREVRDLMLQEPGIQVGDRLQVIIATSLAGGTGAGMFLDLAFLLRDEFRGANPDIIGYLMLPSVFAPDSPHVEALYANAYAALEELEFYSLRKDLLHSEWRVDPETTSLHDFEVEWRPGYPRKIPGPPFNVCYFIDNQTRGGGIIGPEHKTDLCDMIAENIFIDFSSEGLAAQRRSVRANLDGQLINPFVYSYLDGKGQVIHKEQFSCRFSAFGVSKIYVPVDYLVNRCKYSFAHELLEHVLNNNDSSATADDPTAKSFLSKLGISIEEIEKKFDISTLEQRVREDWRKRRSGLRDTFQTKMKKRERSGFNKIIENKFEEYESNVENTEGDILLSLKWYQRKYLEGSKKRIREEVENWLRTPDCRTLAAIARLKNLGKKLEQQKDALDRKKEESISNAQKASDKMEKFKDILGDEEPRRFVHYFERESMFILLRFICDLAAQYFVQKVKQKVYSQAAEFCKELQEFIGHETTNINPDRNESETVRGGMIKNVWEVHELLDELKSEVNRSLQSYQRRETHVIFDNLFKPSTEFKDYYKLGNGKSIGQEQLKGQEKLWLQHMSQKLKVDGFLSLPDKREEIGLPELLKDFVTFCRSRFDYLPGSNQADAIHMLDELYRECPARVTESIKRLVKNSQVWIRPSALSATEFPVTANYHEAVLWGISQTGKNVEKYEKFKNTLRPYLQAISSRRRIYPSVDVSHDSVYLYNEYAGIPLMFMARMDEYRKAYKKYFCEHEGRSPHIDYNDDKFTDIIIRSTEEIQKYIEAQRVLFQGVILRVVELKEEEGKFVFYYQNRSAFPPQRLKLGPQKTAVESLLQHTDTKAAIEKEIAVRRERLAQNHSTWLQYFTTLSYHINGDDFTDQKIPPGPFPPTWGKHCRTYSPRYPEEHCALSHARDEEKEALKKALGINESVLSRLFVEFFEQLDEFTEPLAFQDKTLRVMREEVLRAAQPKDEERRCA